MRARLLAVVAVLFAAGCASVTSAPRGPALQGTASWYGNAFHGRITASGERFDMYAMTAAHRTLPFGARVRVTNRRNGRRLIVRINDRGPYARGRIIDLSYAAAKELGMIQAGVVPVDLDVVSLPRKELP